MVNDDGANGITWQFTFVGWPTVPSLKSVFSDDLVRLGEVFNGPWITTCDFNVVLHQLEKVGENR